MFPRSPSPGALLLCLVAGLAACNALNPSGDGEASGYDALVAEGVKHLKAKEFSDARGSFEQATALRSHGKEAWDGWIEARFGEVEAQTGIDNAAVLAEVMKMVHDKAQKPFWSLPFASQDRFYQYFKALDQAEASYLRGMAIDSFPVAADRQAYRGIKSGLSLLRVCDYDRNGHITPADTALVNVCSDGSGGLTRGGPFLRDKLLAILGSLSDASGNVDTAQVSGLNAYLTGVDSTFGALETTFGSDQSFSQVDSFLTVRGQEILFYRAADRLDNDGDGCADEEIVDGMDNDGDGFLDEDYRVGYLDTARIRLHPTSPPLVAFEDDISLERLVGSDAVTAQHRAVWRPQNRDSSDALLYVQGIEWLRHPGLFKRYLPYVDSSNADFAAKHWKFRPEWSSTDLAFLGSAGGGVPRSGDSTGGLLSHAQLVAVRKVVLGLSDPYSRVRAGKLLVGGCWSDVALPAVGGRRP